MDESDDEGSLRDGYLLLVDGGQASDVTSRVTAPLQGLISATRARAAAPTRIGLLTFQRNRTTRLASAVSQSPIAIFPRRTQALSVVPMASECALDEALHVRVRTITDEDRRDDQDQQERGREDAIGSVVTDYVLRVRGPVGGIPRVHQR
jgi:hypothetical protein